MTAVQLSVVLAAVLASSAIAQTAHGCAATHYKITALPFHPLRINNSGVIAGTTEEHRAATWAQKDGLHEIELPVGFTSAESTGINRAGDIVGFATKAGSSQPFAFRFSDGKVSLLSADPSKAAAINDSGDVAGQSAERLVVWRTQKMIPLGECCGGIVHAMNNRGQVVGQLNDKQGRYGAFLWAAAHGLRSIAPPHASMSIALAINNAGHVLIQSFTPNEVFLQERGTLRPVHLSDEVASQPLALNNCDVIVGEFGAASDFYHAFIWDRQNGLRDLNSLISTGFEWTLESATDINDRGEITGIGTHGNERDAGYLLTPDRPARVTKQPLR